uniref:Uncharacterized protein n=1 Tax=Rhizophora mucronata TaxID=61149 RepID=A0A2P2JJN3_RHIMU
MNLFAFLAKVFRIFFFVGLGGEGFILVVFVVLTFRMKETCFGKNKKRSVLCYCLQIFLGTLS